MRRLIRIPQARSFVKHFFRLFQIFFSAVSLSRCLSATACVIYHPFTQLSSPFFQIFSPTFPRFFPSFSALFPLSTSCALYDALPHHILFYAALPSISTPTAPAAAAAPPAPPRWPPGSFQNLTPGYLVFRQDHPDRRAQSTHSSFYIERQCSPGSR